MKHSTNRAMERPSVLNSTMLSFVFILGHLYILHGKAFSIYLFAEKATPLREGAYSVQIYAALGLASVLVVLLRYSFISIMPAVVFGIAIGLTTTIYVTIETTGPSVLIFLLQLYFFGSMIVVVFLDRYVNQDGVQEYWTAIISAVLRVARYVVALFVAGFALLRFVSEHNYESQLGFLTTLIYPVLILVLSLATLGLWIFVPAWEKSAKEMNSHLGSKRVRRWRSKR